MADPQAERIKELELHCEQWERTLVMRTGLDAERINLLLEQVKELEARNKALLQARKRSGDLIIVILVLLIVAIIIWGTR